MSAQDKEIAQLHDDMVEDLYALVNKYMKIISLDVPENDEKEALKKITVIMRDALHNVEEVANNMPDIKIIGEDD